MPTTIKAALKKWEEASGKKSSEAKEIKLIGVYPPIEKMEGPLHILVNCEKLSLSTNLIAQIQNLQENMYTYCIYTDRQSFTWIIGKKLLSLLNVRQCLPELKTLNNFCPFRFFQVCPGLQIFIFFKSQI